MGIKKYIEKANLLKRESNNIEFKERFDVKSKQDWCEILKDIVAMANSGGGIILIGIKDDGSPSDFDITQVINLDPAMVTDKLSKYTGEQFSDFEIEETVKDEHNVALLQIGISPIPMIFTQPGDYETEGHKKNIAFAKGTVYFRHGAKSEPGNTNDLRKVIERELHKIRKSWLNNIRKIVEAPVEPRIEMLPTTKNETISLGSVPIRIVEDPNAPPYQNINPDQIYPYRQKDVVKIINQRLEGKKTINAYDVRCIRKVYRIDGTKPSYYYKSKFASPQYSLTFVDWLVYQFEENNSFFDDARRKVHNGNVD